MAHKPNIVSCGAGSPVILLHSSMSSKSQWDKLMRELCPGFYALAFDLSGYGETPYPKNQESFSLTDEAHLVEDFLKEMVPPKEPVHLVGHSYGAAVALLYNYKNPERVRSLTIFEPVAFHLLPDTEEALDHAIKLAQGVDSHLQQERFAEAAQFFIDYWNGEGTFQKLPDAYKNIFAENIKKLPLDMRALISCRYTLDDYSRIQQPVCLMTGTRSPITSRRVSEMLAEKLPDCQFHRVEGNHMAPVSNAEAVNRVITSFLESIT